MTTFRWLTTSLLLSLLCLTADLSAQIPPIDFANQGFSMKLRYCNVGSFGHVACPPFNPGTPGGCTSDSIGLEYPLGSHDEHLYGGGIWVGGKLDTATAGVSPQLRLTSVTYEGWSGPYYEFYPGNTSSDTIWQVGGGAPKPPGWDEYWGTDLPYRPFADDNQYCCYTDTSVRVSQHIPLRLKVIHSSYTWSDPDADGIHIVEYRIFNRGSKIIDSAYVALFFEPQLVDSGSFARAIVGYIPEAHLAFVMPTTDTGATPFGVSLLGASRPLDSLRMTFMWYRGMYSPPDDTGRYSMISSGIISGDEYPIPSDLRFLLAGGPFEILPHPLPGSEATVIAFAILCADNLAQLGERAERARQIYANGGWVSVGPRYSELPQGFALMQNYPNPFNGETRIGYRVSPARTTWSGGGLGSGGVRLVVYDMLGREVATLVNGPVEAGDHTATFSAGNLPSGVYYYRLSSGGFTQTKAMMLLR